jgi:hypothetical protein
VLDHQSKAGTMRQPAAALGEQGQQGQQESRDRESKEQPTQEQSLRSTAARSTRNTSTVLYELVPASHSAPLPTTPHHSPGRRQSVLASLLITRRMIRIRQLESPDWPAWPARRTRTLSTWSVPGQDKHQPAPASTSLEEVPKDCAGKRIHRPRACQRFQPEW